MTTLNDEPEWLLITTKDVPLHEYRLRVAGRLWTILHTGAMLTPADETHFFNELMSLLPYGVPLWSATIALAHDVASRAEAFRDKRILELGAGTGLPGIVAASLGGQVVQTDRHELALSVCKRNGERNAVQMIEYRFDNAAHDCRTIRIPITAHPGRQVTRRKRHRILRCHHESRNSYIHTHCQWIVCKGTDEGIGNKNIAIRTLHLITTQCAWRRQLARSFLHVAIWSRHRCVYHESYPHDLRAGDCRRPIGVVH